MRIATAVAILSALFACAALAQVFKWTDAEGRIHYGDQPPQSGRNEKLNLRVQSYEGPAQVTDWSKIIRDKSNGLSTSDQAFADYLHASDTPSRQAIAAVFFPGFSDTAARTIRALLTRHPYPQGHARRSFRAPGHRLQAENAAVWVWQVWLLTREYPQNVGWFAVHAGLLPAWTAHRLGLSPHTWDDGLSPETAARSTEPSKVRPRLHRGRTRL